MPTCRAGPAPQPHKQTRHVTRHGEMRKAKQVRSPNAPNPDPTSPARAQPPTPRREIRKGHQGRKVVGRATRQSINERISVETACALLRSSAGHLPRSGDRQRDGRTPGSGPLATERASRRIRPRHYPDRHQPALERCGGASHGVKFRKSDTFIADIEKN
jgi:hypothetical protein